MCTAKCLEMLGMLFNTQLVDMILGKKQTVYPALLLTVQHAPCAPWIQQSPLARANLHLF